MLIVKIYQKGSGVDVTGCVADRVRCGGRGAAGETVEEMEIVEEVKNVNVYECVKEVKGHIIVREIGTDGPYYVMVREYGYVTFETLEAAVEYIRNKL